MRNSGLEAPEIEAPTTIRGDDREPLLAARGFTKSFSGKTVLRGVDLDLRPGEVHGLLGHNGSGKSTLIKILSGYHAPDPGARLELAGQPVSLPIQPGEGQRHGMAFVHQNVALAEDLTILENLLVGRGGHRLLARLDWREERRVATELLDRVGLTEIDVDTPVSALDGIQRTQIAIGKALDEVRSFESGVLVLDEPTAYLPRDGVELLFRAMRQVAAEGMAVLFVSHRLDEVKQITNRVTVLRDGELAAESETASVSEQDLAELVLGRAMGQFYPDTTPPRKGLVAGIRGLSGKRVRSLDLDIHEGEILGITGLAGMGQEEVPYLLFGAAPAASGHMTLLGKSIDLRTTTPREAIAAGLALLPEQRLRYGGAVEASVRENVTLPSLSRYFRRGMLRLGVEYDRVFALLGRFGVRPPDPGLSFAALSGGNQQKALIAKWFEVSPSLMLMHEPTHGVDVGAKHQVFELIAAAAAAGQSILMASAEYEDLAHLCDRVLVIRDGEIIAELRGDSLTAERIVECCYVGA